MKYLFPKMVILLSATLFAACVPEAVSVTSVSLNPTSLVMEEGETFELNATVSPANADNKSLEWSSDDQKVATVKDGLVTAKKQGKTKIRVKTVDGNKTAVCDVTVNAKIYPVDRIDLNMKTATMTEGETLTLKATVYPSNATNKKVSWESSNKAVATVDKESGKVTALKAGSTVITVTSEEYSEIYTTCTVTVEAKVYPVESVKLNKTTLTMTEGDETTLTATVYPDNATNKKVSWGSSNTAVAAVDDNGKVTALKAGSTTITVTTDDGGKTATCTVTVEAKVYPVENVTLNKTTLTMTEGDEETLFANVYPSNATNKKVSWESSNEAVATVDKESGKVTALKAGSTTITVRTDDGDKTATCTVTVEPKVYPVESVKLNKTALTMTEGDEETLSYEVLPSNATNKMVTWQSTNESVASVIEGTVTAKKAGEATIIVKTVDGGLVDRCKVIVNPKVYPVERVTLDRTEMTLTEGDEATLTATVYPDNATDKEVSWESSNKTVASVDANGRVTAHKAGSATITVRTEDGGKTATCIVTVEPKVYPVERVTLDKTVLTLTEGDEATLIATVYPDNATNKEVSWESSNKTVASVDANGRVTALKAGSATITVRTEDGGKTATCIVTVEPKVYPVERVTLDKTVLTLTEGDEATLTATVYPDNATNKEVSWESSNKTVATVDAYGRVTALKAGSATITVRTEDGGKTATCRITVDAKVYPVESVTLDKTELTLAEGDEATLTATVYPYNATNKEVSWESNNKTVATVNANGKVTALKAGSAVITVRTEDGGKTAVCDIIVTKEYDNEDGEKLEDEDGEW